MSGKELDDRDQNKCESRKEKEEINKYCRGKKEAVNGGKEVLQ